jgi:hypothetical protein
MGRERYPATRNVMVTADCGGSNGPRLRLWKVELQRLADETGLTFQVCHYPPGTSKWNKIEHRMFCHITQNWRATPLTSRLAVVELIANTTTKTGLTIRCELDTNTYEPVQIILVGKARQGNRAKVMPADSFVAPKTTAGFDNYASETISLFRRRGNTPVGLLKRPSATFRTDSSSGPA